MMVSVKRKTLKRVLVIMLSALLTYCTVSMVVTKIVYDAIFERYDGEATVLSEESEALVARRQEHFYDCGEVTLAGYFYDAGESVQSTLIVLAPGFHAGGDDYLPQIGSLLRRGWSVFAFDPSGSCGSEGESYQGFPQEISDLDATLAYVEQQGRFGCDKLVLLGHSRGGYAAGCILGYGHDIDAVVTVSGVNSAMDAVMGYSTEYVGPLAYGNYGFLWAYQALLFGADTTDLQACEEIAQSDVPVLVVQGSADAAFPPQERSIYAHKAEIQREGVSYLLLEQPGQNGHTDLLFEGQEANEMLMEEISSFLEKTLHER